MLISDFNLLPLKSQKLVSQKMLNSQNSKLIDFFTNLMDLIEYLLQFRQLKKQCLAIEKFDDDRLFDLNPTHCVEILFSSTEVLFNSNLLETPNFTKIMNEFTEFCFEIKYPSDSFKAVYNCLKKIKNKNTKKVSIAVFISGIEETDQQFQNDDKIKSIKIDGSSVSTSDEDGEELIIQCTSIDERSFEGCSSLIEIEIPNTIKSIGSFSFSKCTSLTKISIPSSVKTIDDYAFSGCLLITEIQIPSSVKLISSGLFEGCSSLKSVSIPSSVTKIEKNAFRNCSALKMITIPSSVNSIGANTFFGCSSLNGISFPSSIKAIGKSTFEKCTSLTKLSIPTSVISIGGSAFSGCSALTEITIPNSVTSIGGSAFSGCSALEKISVPKSIDLSDTNINKNAVVIRI